MSRVSLQAVAAHTALAGPALSLAACSDVPVQPDESALTTRAAVASQGDDEVVAGDVIVALKDGASLDDLVKAHGLGKGAQGFAHKFDIVRTTRGNERAMAARLAKDPRVAYAEPNYIRQPLAVSPRLWQIANPGGLNMKFNEKDTGGRVG